MTSHRPDSIILAKINKIKREIADDDYQVIKAARDGVDVEKLYPGHRAKYAERIKELHDLETEFSEEQHGESP